MGNCVFMVEAVIRGPNQHLLAPHRPTIDSRHEYILDLYMDAIIYITIYSYKLLIMFSIKNEMYIVCDKCSTITMYLLRLYIPLYLSLSISLSLFVCIYIIVHIYIYIYIYSYGFYVFIHTCYPNVA